ncbi:MAG: chemotaxis protein CheB [Bacteroidia bacterium]
MEEDKIERKCDGLVIGGSAGSLDVILGLLPLLRPDFTFPIIIVLHRKQSSDSTLSNLFSGRTVVPVKEVEDKDKILAGTIFIAPADYHLLVEKNGVFSLDASEKVNYSRPSIDVTYDSAAEAYGSSLVCMLLSGASADGVEGLKKVKKKNGRIWVQDPATAESPFMPEQAIAGRLADRIIAPADMAAFINSL